MRAPAALTGSAGRIGPALVQVPPYIAVEVALSSADGATYELTIAGRRLVAGGRSPRGVRVSLPGLRPNGSYLATQPDGRPPVRISASAEPGP